MSDNYDVTLAPLTKEEWETLLYALNRMERELINDKGKVAEWCAFKKVRLDSADGIRDKLIAATPPV